jgi:hypothetical protein
MPEARAVDYGGQLHKHTVIPGACELCHHLVEDCKMHATTKSGKTFVFLEEVDCGRLRLKPHIEDAGRHWIHISIEQPWLKYVEHQKQHPEGQWPPRLVGQHSNEIDDVLQDPKFWMKECLANHDRCQREEARRLPTRVIEVGQSGAVLKPRLHISEGCMGSFVALSHCWGGSLVTHTRSSNIEEHCRGLAFETLPRTFQDAITITKALGVRYLWIDALCIIQDSMEDWNVEASRMDSIYSDALVVLVAAVGGDSHAGMLKQAAPDEMLQVPALNLKKTFGSPVDEKVHIGIPRNEPRGFGPALTSLESGIQRGWRTRGWTFQEEALAQRLVYFTDS